MKTFNRVLLEVIVALGGFGLWLWALNEFTRNDFYEKALGLVLLFAVPYLVITFFIKRYATPKQTVEAPAATQQPSQE